MRDQIYQADVVIAGAGLAGIVTAYELLNHHKFSVLLIDKDIQEKFGGLAKESFGGVHLIDTPHQRRQGFKDSPELAWRDWQSCARWDDEGDEWPKQWAKLYCENSIPFIFEFLDQKKVRFLPIANWAERGLDHPYNTLPRWHIALGTGYEIVKRMILALEEHPHRSKLTILFGHEVNGIDIDGGRVLGIRGRRMTNGEGFRAKCVHVVVASGGFCGGDLSRARANWYKPWGEPPEILLNGAHKYGDGMLHDVLAGLGGNLTHMDKHWHYAAGIHHPAKRRPVDGLSLVPPRSALWVNALGERIGPRPLVSYTDTRHLVETILKQPGKYSWQVMNWKIAVKELAVSGCNYMTAFRNKQRVKMILTLLFGHKELVKRLIRECPEDIVIAKTLDELVGKMNERSLFGYKVDIERLRADIQYYDDQIDRGPAYFNDEQLRRIMNFRTYIGDRVRTCKFRKILDPKALPLIAIREFILSRKSLGGIQTDLSCRVLKIDGGAIPGLYAVGETAGFGGGGIHGKGTLEGTFLGSCVLTGRVCGQSIAKGT